MIATLTITADAHYDADDLGDGVPQVFSGASSDSACITGVMNHQLTIAINIWFGFIFTLLAS